MSLIRVLIADDQLVVREGLRSILEGESALEVVGAASNGEQTVELVGNLDPDLVLMDLQMPGMNGIQATREIRKRYPDTYILVLTTFTDDEWVFDAMRAGASGYLLKDSDGDDIIAAIKGTVQGRTYIDPALADRLLRLAREQVPPDLAIFADLSEREITILRFVARGLTNMEIAVQLSLAEGTVRNNVSLILNKLGASDRTKAAALAWHHGLVQRRGGSLDLMD